MRNNVGTAAGLIIKEGTKTLILLPGPPRELMPVFETSAAPYLRRQSKAKYTLLSRVIKTTGLPESAVCPKVSKFLKMEGSVTVGIYAHVAQVDVKITAKAKTITACKKKIAPIERQIRKKLGSIVFGADDETLESLVGKLLIKKRKTLAVAESCTGGLIANRITDIPGSTKYLLMGTTTYSNEAKTTLLGVPPELIRKHGAVSRQVAMAMAKGTLNLSGADIAIAVTGIAGPSGGTKRKPVGTIYIALAMAPSPIPSPPLGERVRVRGYNFSGTRQDIKYQASQAALDMIRKHLSFPRKRESII